MRKHLIIGRLGSSDRAKIQAATDEVTTTLNLMASDNRLGHGMHQALLDLADLGLLPSEMGIDLLVLAAHIQAADTCISRKTESQDSWTREIRLVVPVSDPPRWNGAGALLKQMLDFLTGDLWVIEFRGRPSSFSSLVPARKPQPHNRRSGNVHLFSGGLDSLIGAIDFLERTDDGLFVSHAGDAATSDAQGKCFDKLKNHYPERKFERLRVWMNFPANFVDGVEHERTTRARSFLFISLGVLAGSAFREGFTLHVPENGFISLNVPLDPLRLGSNTTRTTHPFFLARWRELQSHLGISGRIENPYWLKTKGEMVLECANQEFLRHVIADSLSCSSPAKGRWKGRGIEHCGYCLPCLVRRAALKKAFGSANDPTSYTLRNLQESVLDTRKAEGAQVRSLQIAIARLRDKPDLAKILIHKPGPLSDVEPTQHNDLSEVYRRSLEEIDALLTRVHAQPV